MDTPLSPNQVQALHVLRAAGSMTTEAFAQACDFVHTEDQARNLLARLEKRGHVAGDGKGRTRVWSYRSTPELELSLGPPDPGAGAGRNGSPETGVRTYVVLEQRRLDELVAEVLDEAGAVDLTDEQAAALAQASAFDRVADPEARNTEHALRLAAKEVYDDVPGHHAPKMVAVAERMFQIQTLQVRNLQTVGFAG